MDEEIMPELSIDCVIFGFDGSLKVLLVKHKEGISQGCWGLPGGWITYNESLDQAASRLLFLLTGLDNIFLDQLKAFGAVNRFPERRVVTVAYYSMIRTTATKLVAGYTASDVKWFAIHDTPALMYDHQEIVSFAKKQLHIKVRQEPIGFNLLPEKFTLFQLQQLYESTLQVKLDKPNFRRKILKIGLLEDCREMQANVSHRFPKLYRFDKSRYDQLKTTRFLLDF
ncbi:MAG: NUDIX hydrolase [Cyclobacteriaceae bacterium]